MSAGAMGAQANNKALPSSISVVIVEAGAPWPMLDLPGAMTGTTSAPADCVVLVQHGAEALDAFAARVEARLAALAAHGASVVRGVLSTAHDPSHGALTARRRIVCALVAARARHTATDLVVVAAGDGSPRHDLFALADAVYEAPDPKNLSLRVKLLEAAPGLVEPTPERAARPAARESA